MPAWLGGKFGRKRAIDRSWWPDHHRARAASLTSCDVRGTSKRASLALRQADDAIVVEEVVLPNFAIGSSAGSMSTMNISLPEALKARLRELLLTGAGSAPGPTANTAYFDGLRKHVKSGPRSRRR